MKSNTNTNCPVPTGKLLIIGGAENKGENNAKEPADAIGVKMDVLKCFIDLIGDKPIIEVITSAGTDDPKGSFEQYKKAFKQLGASYVGHIHHDTREDIKLNSIKDRLNTANAIFFSGGDQLKLTSVYGGTDILLLLKQRYIHDGLIIGGTSAGAMALSTPMIYDGAGRDEMIAGNVKVTTGLEFLRDVCIDTHFVSRGRFVRISQVIAENPANIGMGIEEDTAVIICNGTDAEVIGYGVIIIIEGQNSYGTDITDHANDVPITIRGINVNILSRGQKYVIPQLNPAHQ
jgi:cyanophycinase